MVASPADDISALRRQAEVFQQRLSALKRARPDIRWYPYDSLANLVHLDRLLTGDRRRLLALAGGDPIVDLGCADGDLAFFLESLGCTLYAVDYAVTHHNSLAGAYALKEALGSSVTIQEANIDGAWTFPVERCGLALLLGALYHLKNPFAVLETIARHARYCVLSTRVARCLPDGAPIGGQPLAYLVDERELNEDNSNFWIFTETALRRMLRRAHWEVLDWLATGDQRASDPVHPEHDERVFCLARSTWEMANVELGEGWHPSEGTGWRWTRRRFAARARWEAARPPALRLSLYVPPALLETHASVTLTGRANGQPLPPATFTAPGDYVYERRLPAAPELALEFEVDGTISTPDDARELGLIVAALRLE